MLRERTCHHVTLGLILLVRKFWSSFPLKKTLLFLNRKDRVFTVFLFLFCIRMLVVSCRIDLTQFDQLCLEMPSNELGTKNILHFFTVSYIWMYSRFRRIGCSLWMILFRLRNIDPTVLSIKTNAPDFLNVSLVY